MPRIRFMGRLLPSFISSSILPSPSFRKEYHHHRGDCLDYCWSLHLLQTILSFVQNIVASWGPSCNKWNLIKMSQSIDKVLHLTIPVGSILKVQSFPYTFRCKQISDFFSILFNLLFPPVWWKLFSTCWPQCKIY